MAEPTAIVIRRQVLDVEVDGTESDGMALQQRLPDVCNRVLAPALESVLSGIDRVDAHLSIERLAIDAGDVSLADFERELADAVRQAVESFFRDHIPPPGVTPAPTASDGIR